MNIISGYMVLKIIVHINVESMDPWMKTPCDQQTHLFHAYKESTRAKELPVLKEKGHIIDNTYSNGEIILSTTIIVHTNGRHLTDQLYVIYISNSNIYVF